MKQVIFKYANLLLIFFLVLIPLKLRAKVLWFLFSVKQKMSRK